MVLRAPTAETITMDKDGIAKAIYQRLLAEDTRTGKTLWSRIFEPEIKCYSVKRAERRGGIFMFTTSGKLEQTAPTP